MKYLAEVCIHIQFMCMKNSHHMAVLTMSMMTTIVMFASFSLLPLVLSSTFSGVVFLLAIHYYCTYGAYIPLQNIRFVRTCVHDKMVTSFGL